MKKQTLLSSCLTLALAAMPPALLTVETAHTSAVDAASQVAPMYALDFVGAAATGYSFNDAGDVVGNAYTDPGCGPFCLPPQENVLWRDGARIVLPPVPGGDPTNYFPRYINNDGLIAGVVVLAGGSTSAAVWRPDAFGAYSAENLGTLPGMSSATVAGFDGRGRIVGWASTGGALPSDAAPYMWSDATGMVNLEALGYPKEIPAAVSPGGNVVTTGSWYSLDTPGSMPLPPVPWGFLLVGSNGSAINDAGDQAHFLISTSTQNLAYPFRLSNGGAWQQISNAGTGRLSRYGIGSISPAQDVTFTALSTGAVAPGPAGTGFALGSLISPAYSGAAVTIGGPMNASGQILAQVIIGRSARLMKMTPVTPCTADCLVSSALVMTAQFVEDPAFPGSCFEGGKMYNRSSATVTITSETGAPLGNVRVSGRFLDDYWTDHRVTGTTNNAGVVSWTYEGLCGVGAIAFLVDDAQLGTRSFDRTRGLLTNSVIPSTTPPPPNQAPVPVPVVTCSAGRTCAFDGTGSYDPDGTIVNYEWLAKNGTTLWNAARFTMIFPKSGKNSVTLRVTDNGGLSASKKVSFTVLR